MRKFTVTVRATVWTTYEVEADSAEEAESAADTAWRLNVTNQNVKQKHVRNKIDSVSAAKETN